MFDPSPKCRRLMIPAAFARAMNAAAAAAAAAAAFLLLLGCRLHPNPTAGSPAADPDPAGVDAEFRVGAAAGGAGAAGKLA